MAAVIRSTPWLAPGAGSGSDALGRTRGVPVMAWDADGFCLRCQQHLSAGCSCRGVAAEARRRKNDPQIPGSGPSAARDEPPEAAPAPADQPHGELAAAEAGPAAVKPEIETGTAPETIRAIQRAIDGGQIPDTYVSGGRVVHGDRVSGTGGTASGEDDSPLPVTASDVNAAVLANLLAWHTYTFKTKPSSAGGGKEEVTPPTPVLAAALAPKEWGNLRSLFGIVGAPVLRPDGSLFQKPGYDPATGLYLASKVPLDRVPDEPTAQQVSEARMFLLDQFLGDFPWVGPADKANYLGLLVTPVLRSYLRTLIPFGLVTSTMPGSGKTILTCGLGMLYGQRVLTWPGSDDAELRKAITSVLADPVGAIIFDNIAEGTVIDSPVLARLITDRTWADRLLGGNKIGAFANDRVWTATGNNLRLGGDMRTRSVLVGLNPDMPRPEERTGFKIPDLDQWILESANQRAVLWHLLVLVADWIRHGAPRREGVTMRQFTSWAAAVGGFLAHHGVEGFLANAETVREIDDEEAEWTAFFARGGKIYGDQWVTSNDLRKSANITVDSLGTHDQWDGLFRTDNRGQPVSVKSLGKMLTSQSSRYRGSYVLEARKEPHDKIKQWRVEEWTG